MKNITPRAFLLGAALLSVGTLFASTSSAQAAPRRFDNTKNQRRDVKEARHDVRQERHDLTQAQRNLQRQQSQLRNHRPGYRPGYRPVAPIRRPGTYRPGTSYNGAYTGRVTSVHSSQNFDIRVGGNVYNVYTVRRTPRGLSTGDLVRVSGTKMYANDIRNATASIIRNG